MLDTDSKDVKALQQGILVVTGPGSGYREKRERAMKEHMMKERINILEAEVVLIKEILKQILQKVSDVQT